MGQDEYLYHYTSVSALAMILKSKSFMFNSLMYLDDIQEAEILDEQKYAKYCFISSWTDIAEEIIPMWKMYTNMVDGIRIKMPINPFKQYRLNSADFYKHGNFGSEYHVTGYGMDIIVPPEEFFNKAYSIGTNNQNHILHKVEYTSDKELLKPKIKKIINGNTVLNMGVLGKYKNEYWAFQSEWRYSLIYMPFSVSEATKYAENNMQQLLLRIELAPDLPFKKRFLQIDEAKFTKMEITLSPKISDGSREIVDLLREKYNPGMKILPSELEGKIR